MWDGFFTLLAMSLVMGIASFLAGSLPLSFSLSQNHSRVISALGQGLLVGTCLIIIIPEGMETLYSAQHSSNEHPSSPHAFVGLALIAGFILMYLIDTLPAHASHSPALHISLAHLSSGPHAGSTPTTSSFDTPTPSSATTIGLVIHAAADGIALAASSFVSARRTGLLVFGALMVHKAPAAFGLTSVLLAQGHSKRSARGHLLVFSAAAPVGALVTWGCVQALMGGQVGDAGMWTGLLLLFSGGTFLYVAMHTMGGKEETEEVGYAVKESGLKETGLVVLGMCLPLAASFGHAH